MKGLILKDILNLKGSFKTLGIMMIFFAVVFIPQGNDFVFGMVILMFAMMVITTITYDDLAKWDSYALTMPITRKEMILSKYLVMTILNTIGAILAMIIGIFGAIIMGKIFSIEILLSIGIIYLIAFIFGSVVIPLVYKFGTEKARLLLILCGIIPVALVFLVDQLGISWPETDNPWIYLGLLIGLTVVGLVISINASFKIYQNKEF